MKYLLSFVLLVSSFQGATNEISSVQDLYEWLEDENSTQTLQWLTDQELRCASYFQNLPYRKSIQKELYKILEYEFSGIPQKCKENYYFISRKKEDKHASLYVKKLGEEPRVILNPVLLNERCALTDFSVSPDGSLITYGLSESGSDWQVWHIKELSTGKDLPDQLQNIRFLSPIWDAEGQGLYYFCFNNNNGQEKSYTTNWGLYYHQIGTSLEQDTLIYYKSDPSCLYYSLSVAENGRYLLFSYTKGSNDKNGVLYKDLYNQGADFIELLPPGKAQYDYFGSYDGRFYFVTNESAPKGKVISIDPLNPSADHWQELISEEEGIIEQACFAGTKLVIAYLKDVCSQIKIYDLSGQLHHNLQVPNFSTIGSICKSWYLQGSKDDPIFFYPQTTFTQPITIYRCNADTGISEVFAAPQISWDPKTYEVNQVYFPSKDGTLIPMFITHKKGLELNGNSPALLYGYGGFGIPITPSFNAMNIAWMNMGGIYASANIRGGGEYGEAWHRAGMLKNKQTVFDDFIAAAEWLLSNGYTTPSKLAILGRSNGGLLVGACLVQRPELFQAAIIGVGVLDMLRFHRFTVGWAWMAEYGCPDNPEDFSVLHAYSPYHRILEDADYPATLITTADHDNRVVPAHSFKFAAALQAVQDPSTPILLRVYKQMGHGPGKTKDQRVEEDVDLLSFLIEELKINYFDEKER